MKRSVVFGGLLCVVWSTFGCGSSDSKAAAPPAQCDTFLNEYCAHGADCIEQTGVEPGVTRDQQYQNCLNVAKRSIVCANAVAVGPTYSACLSDVKAIDCSAYSSVPQGMAPSLPTNCKGVILFPAAK